MAFVRFAAFFKLSAIMTGIGLNSSKDLEHVLVVRGAVLMFFAVILFKLI
jgi:hypothetical protein